MNGSLAFVVDLACLVCAAIAGAGVLALLREFRRRAELEEAIATARLNSKADGGIMESQARYIKELEAVQRKLAEHFSHYRHIAAGCFDQPEILIEYARRECGLEKEEGR